MQLKLARMQLITAGEGNSACRHIFWDARKMIPAQGALLPERLDNKTRQTLRAPKKEIRRDELSCRSLTSTAVNSVTAAATLWPLPIYLLVTHFHASTRNAEIEMNFANAVLLQMLVAPAWKWTIKLVDSELIYTPIAAAYVFLLIHSWEPDTLSLIMPGSLKAGLSGEPDVVACLNHRPSFAFIDK